MGVAGCIWTLRLFLIFDSVPSVVSIVLLLWRFLDSSEGGILMAVITLGVVLGIGATFPILSFTMDFGLLP
jgi:hypothetical protein